MLNRRILRVKAMQALYSYFTTRESLKDVVRERLEKQFYPDPAKDDFSQADWFTERRKKASRMFVEGLEKDTTTITDEEEDISLPVSNAINSYHEELSKEKRVIRNSMLHDVDEIFRLYLKLIQLPVELAHIEKIEKEKKDKAHIKKESSWKWHFINNSAIEDLTRNEAFNKALINEKVTWDEQPDTLKSWYKEIIREDEEIKTYQQTSDPSDEQHKDILIYLFKKVIFKNETINESLAELDLHWAENKPILKSLVVKTFKDYEPDLDPPYELKEVSKNWEEDIRFFEESFQQTIRKSDELDQLIVQKIKNWDINRVATLDRIILKMALTEMMLFPAIPVKVTINEFIEISKQYSTPKSKQFINGILDVMANELTSDGVIKKSGRGLIDNK